MNELDFMIFPIGLIGEGGLNIDNYLDLIFFNNKSDDLFLYLFISISNVLIIFLGIIRSLL